MKTLILDTTILSNFARARSVDLLMLALEGRGTVTPTVLQEVRQGEMLGYLPQVDWGWLGLLTPTAGEEAFMRTLETQLDAGESESLAVALARRCVLVTDDLAARRLAKYHAIPVSGTLGLLMNLVKKEQLAPDDGNKLLAVMIGNGYRSPVQRLDELSFW